MKDYMTLLEVVTKCCSDLGDKNGTKTIKRLNMERSCRGCGEKLTKENTTTGKFCKTCDEIALAN